MEIIYTFPSVSDTGDLEKRVFEFSQQKPT